MPQYTGFCVICGKRAQPRNLYCGDKCKNAARSFRLNGCDLDVTATVVVNEEYLLRNGYPIYPTTYPPNELFTLERRLSTQCGVRVRVKATVRTAPPRFQCPTNPATEAMLAQAWEAQFRPRR